MASSTDVNSPDLMKLKDADNYYRQVGSKALIMTSLEEKRKYEQARKFAEEEKQRRDLMQSRIERVETQLNSLESKIDRLSDLLASALQTEKT